MYFSDVRILKGLVRKRAIDGRGWKRESQPTIACNIYFVNK